MAAGLKFGLFSMNTGACSRPETAAGVARAAEQAGFESLWAGEHVVLPDPQTPPSPLAPDEPILDPVVALTFLAAQTRTVRLGTGIIILPQRNPLALAKELASLDTLSGGRLIFGVGIGYLEPEFRALGAPFEERGPRTIEYLQAMHAIWSQPKPAYQGRFVSFSGVQANPRPPQADLGHHVPIVMGGHSPAAYRRAVQFADGWYGFALDIDATAEAIAGLRRAADRYPRPAELGELEISVTPRGGPEIEQALRYAEMGVHRLILRPPRGADAPGIERWIAEAARPLIGQAG